MAEIRAMMAGAPWVRCCDCGETFTPDGSLTAADVFDLHLTETPEGAMLCPAPDGKRQERIAAALHE